VLVLAGEPLVRVSARRLGGLAALLFVLSLAAPAGTALQPGMNYLPGFCTNSFDPDGYPTLSCTPGTVSVTYFASSTIGLGHPVRIFVAAVALLAALGLRQRSRRLLHAAVAVGALGFFLGGVDGVSRLLVGAAVVCLALAVRATSFGADDPGPAIAAPAGAVPAGPAGA
jgi:hypothetical protein